MPIAPIPSEGELKRELDDLCGKVGYREGKAKFLHLVPGLTRLLIAGGPEPPEDPLEWRDRRDELRAVLADIAKHEVREQLGEDYENAALKVLRLDVTEALPPDQHRDLNEIQRELNEPFGEAPTGTGFRDDHRPLLFKVMAKGLFEREVEARKLAGLEPLLDEGEEEVPPDTEGVVTGRSQEPGRRRMRNSTLAIGAVLAGVLVIWLVSGLFSSSDGEPVPIEQQITDDIPKDGTVRMLREVRLHDDATPSYFVVVRRPPPRNRPRRDQLEPWDELRVYDQDGSDAELQFIGQPVALVGGAPTVKHAGLLSGTRTGRMYQFTLLGIHDTNDDGRAEIYGTLRDQISSVTRPLAVEWNETVQQYEMVPLVPDPPKAPVYGEGNPEVSGGGVASHSHRESRTALRMYVAPDDRHVQLYGATRVSIREVQGFGWVLISGYGAVSGRKIVSRDLNSKREVGRGFAFKLNTTYANVAAITRLTVDVARLQSADGLVEPEQCEIYATTRLWLEQPSGPGTLWHPPPPPKFTSRIVPLLTTNALAKEPLAPQRLNLAKHVLC
ncbi:MAG: hypothetical protein WA862_06985 [Solirubrobacterales bacterium]